MEDLDSLLEDLGKGKSASTVKKQRPPSSRVDLNELENLMEDLASPSSSSKPESRPTSVYTVNSTFTPPAKTTAVVQNSRPQSTAQPVEPQPVFKTSSATPTPTPTPTPAMSSSGSNIDDLDALMESLNASSSRNSRRSIQVQPANAPQQANNPPPQAYNPPPQAYNPPPVVSQPSQTYNNPSQPVQAPKQTSSSAIYSQPRNQTTPTYQPPTSTYTPAPAPAPQKKGDDLDSLLQNLTSQMNSIDSENPASRGQCWTCKGAILGEVIQALGKSFHPEHFTCGNCRSPLGTTNFYEHNGSPHCERCYQELYCPKCAHCDGPVLDRCITALGKKWHVDHFICTQCLRPFQGGNFFERDGRPYCEADFYGLYAPKCGGCNEPIRGDCINALGGQWHPEHFCCTYCQKSFAGGSFYEHGGKPYCETHYHQQTGSLCAGCGKAITGRCVNALDKKWHPEHFVCAFCMNPLAGGSFTENNHKAYCKECHTKLFVSV